MRDFFTPERSRCSARFLFCFPGSLPVRGRTLNSHPRLAPRSAFASRARCLLALRAEVAAAPGDDAAPDLRAAAKARLPRALVHAMARLKFAAIPFRIDVIRYRRAFQLDCLVQYGLNFLIQPRDLVRFQICAEPRGVNARAPERFIRVDVAHTAERALIEQQSLDAAAA